MSEISPDRFKTYTGVPCVSPRNTFNDAAPADKPFPPARMNYLKNAEYFSDTPDKNYIQVEFEVHPHKTRNFYNCLVPKTQSRVIGKRVLITPFYAEILEKKIAAVLGCRKGEAVEVRMYDGEE